MSSGWPDFFLWSGDRLYLVTEEVLVEAHQVDRDTPPGTAQMVLRHIYTQMSRNAYAANVYLVCKFSNIKTVNRLSSLRQLFYLLPGGRLTLFTLT